MKIGFNVLIIAIVYLLPLSVLTAQSGKAIDYYYEGLRLFNLPEATAETDSVAIQLFQRVLELPEDGISRDIQFDCYQNLGMLFLIGNKPEPAIKNFLAAKRYFDLGGLQDTLIFSPLLYLGDSYFMLNKGDSSIYYLQQAEKILDQKQSTDDMGRLYNSLGVTYYEMGNYVQAITYFSKAKSLVWENTTLPPPDDYTRTAVESFQSNEASAYANLRDFKKAIALYLELLQFTTKPDAIYSRLASLYLERNLTDSAAFFLGKIQSESERDLLVNKNLEADIYLSQGKFKQAENLLRQLISKKTEKSSKNFDNSYQLGVSYKLLARVYMQAEVYAPALEAIQQAIVRFGSGFNSLDYRVNPDPSSNNWGMLAMFESLLFKAAVFLKAAKSGYSEDFFRLGFETYKAAFSMVYNMGNFYDNEEARLLLGERTQAAYREAIELSMERYQATGDKEYAWQAFNWTEESKSTALELALNEQIIRAEAGVTNLERQQERDLKLKLSKTNRRLQESTNLKEIENLENELRDIRLTLSRMYSSYQQSVAGDTTLHRDRLDYDYISQVTGRSNTALISFFWEGGLLYRFIITDKGIHAKQIKQASKLSRSLDALQDYLLSSAGRSRIMLDKVSTEVFSILFADVEHALSAKSAWVIFPDGKLTHQPIEMLIDSNGAYLVENHVISYQFSAKFLTESPIIDNALIEKSVGFAPFNKRGFTVGDDVFSSLAYAEAELDGVVNQHFLYRTATKEKFLNVVENASIVHLATHAKAERNNPERAFIAFFPEAEEFRLFYDELFSLDLQRVKLVFLSACDTHTGNILNSEGLISLSRAFAYAGCANIVGSIWKAEDKVVAYLSQRFYGYLKKGNSMPKSLQLAKVDLLNDPAMAQFNHPYFWSSLVFIGGNAPEENIMATWLPPAFLSIAVLMVLLAWNYRRQPSTMKEKNMQIRNFFTKSGKVV